MRFGARFAVWKITIEQPYILVALFPIKVWPVKRLVGGFVAFSYWRSLERIQGSWLSDLNWVTQVVTRVLQMGMIMVRPGVNPQVGNPRDEGSIPSISTKHLPIRRKSAKRDFRWKVDNLFVDILHQRILGSAFPSRFTGTWINHKWLVWETQTNSGEVIGSCMVLCNQKS